MQYKMDCIIKTRMVSIFEEGSQDSPAYNRTGLPAKKCIIWDEPSALPAPQPPAPIHTQPDFCLNVTECYVVQQCFHISSVHRKCKCYWNRRETKCWEECSHSKSDKRSYHLHQFSGQLYDRNFKTGCDIVNLSHDAPLHEHQECLSHIIYIEKVTGLKACALNSAIWKRTELDLLR